MRMFIFHNYSDLHRMLGKVTVRFTETEDETAGVYLDRDLALGRSDFRGEIPTSFIVEEFVKRADLTGPGEGGNDWVFTNVWQAPRSREQAVVDKYGQGATNE